jgi:hypothetical protein
MHTLDSENLLIFNKKKHSMIAQITLFLKSKISYLHNNPFLKKVKNLPLLHKVSPAIRNTGNGIINMLKFIIIKKRIKNLLNFFFNHKKSLIFFFFLILLFYLFIYVYFMMLQFFISFQKFFNEFYILAEKCRHFRKN